MKCFALHGSMVLAAMLIGCISAPPRQASTQPSNISVVADDFERLMNISEEVSRDLFFETAVRDYRAGLVRSEPMLSAQWFEFWRRDARTSSDLAKSSLAKIRRTLTVRIEKGQAGKYVARPEVLVERYSLAERRLTTAAGYRSIYRERYRAPGNSLTDEGIAAPDSYWYAVGSDPELERYVARKIEERMQSRNDSTCLVPAPL